VQPQPRAQPREILAGYFKRLVIVHENMNRHLWTQNCQRTDGLNLRQWIEASINDEENGFPHG
jgi:hypothetical protein